MRVGSSSTSPLRRRRNAGEQDVDAARRRLAEASPAQLIWLAQVLLGGGVLAASTPVELAVVALRVLTRRRGVQVGAAAGTLVSFVVTHVYGTVIRRQLVSEETSGAAPDDDPRSDRWTAHVVFAGAVVLPAAGAFVPATVVGRTRSPLWGLGLWVVVRVVAVTVLVADAGRLHARRERERPAQGPGSTEVAGPGTS